MFKNDNPIQKYKEKHQQSKRMHARAKKLFAADGATHKARFFVPYRPYITRALGSKKWDVDGNMYIDYIMGHGTLLLGHSHPAVVSAVQEQVNKGVLYGDNHELEVKWAELIQEMMPLAERVEFFSCGQEANAMALHLGRIFTGRKKLLRFDNHFHGWLDELAPFTEPAVCQDNVVFIPPNDLEKLEKELSKREYAVLFTEAGGASMGGKVPLEPGFTRAIDDLTKRYGTIWVLDEVVTGFRESPGGWQEIIGIKPDLTTLGKCVGGGLGAGALIGRADIFEAFNPELPPGNRATHSGTWNANPLTASAGLAACKLYRNGEPQKKAAEIAAYFRSKANIMLKEQGISGFLYGRSIVHLYFGPFDYEPVDNTLPPTKDVSKLLNPEMEPVYTRMLLHLLQNGVSNMAGTIFIFSSKHDREDVDLTLQAFSKSLAAMLKEGVLMKS